MYRRIADEYYSGASDTKFLMKNFRIEHAGIRGLKCGDGTARPVGPKPGARRAEVCGAEGRKREWSSWGGRSKLRPHQIGGLGERRPTDFLAF